MSAKVKFPKANTIYLVRSLTIILTMLSLASCKQPSAPTPSTSTPAISTSPEKSGGGYPALQDVITKTKTAVEAKDFAKTKTEFEKFEPSWKNVEDALKSKSPETYNAIEEGMDGVEQGIKSKDQAKVLTALESLKTSVTSAAK